MCGEKLPRRIYGVGEGGSPPHVRGKAELFLYGRLSAGITPACAGKS